MINRDWLTIYHLEYDGKEIYDKLRETLSSEEYSSFLSFTRKFWMPNLSRYQRENVYYTKLGLKMFEKEVQSYIEAELGGEITAIPFSLEPGFSVDYKDKYFIVLSYKEGGDI